MAGTQKIEESSESSESISVACGGGHSNVTSIAERTRRAKAEKRANAVRASVERAIESGRYLVATFRVTEGRLLNDFTCSEFPNGDFKTAVRMFQQECGKIIRRADVPEGVEVPGVTDVPEGEIIDVKVVEVTAEVAETEGEEK